MIYIKNGQPGISKYLLYAIVLIIFYWFTPIPDIWYALTFKKTKGVVKYITFEEIPGKRGTGTYYFPVVSFMVGVDTFECLGSRFQHEGLYVRDTVPVIYDPKQPERAYVFTYLGFWGPELVYVIPLSVVLTLCLGVDIIPKMIIIKVQGFRRRQGTLPGEKSQK